MSNHTKSRYYWRPLPLQYLFSKFAITNTRLFLPVITWVLLIIASILVIGILLPANLLSAGIAELQITKFFIVYPSLLLGILLLFWFGFEWGFIPVFISSVALGLHSGLAVGASLLFGLSFVFGLAIFGLSYHSLNMPIDLKDFKSIAFFIAVAFIAAIASSLGAFIWSLAHHFTALNTIIMWKGWWSGIFFQTILITGPLLFLFTPLAERIKTRYYDLDVTNDISLRWIYNTVILISVVLALFIIAAKWLGNWRLAEVLGAFPAIPESQVAGALTSFEIIFWISLGLILLTGYTAIYLISNWNRQLRERVALQTDQLQIKEQKLQQSLNEKNLLLREIHHRIKNNMAHVSGLLELQQLKIDDEYYSKLIDESKMRIRSMILVHEQLYQTEDLNEIALKKHIRNICDITHDSFKIKGTDIVLNYDLIDYSLASEQAVTVGLIVNEAVMNAHKYAFDGRSKGMITVGLEEIEGKLALSIIDNGIGIDQSKVAEDSLGMELLNSFAMQLSADFTIESGDKGTKISLIFTPE